MVPGFCPLVTPMPGRFRLKNLHWVSRNRYEQRALEKKPRSWSSYHALSSYWGTKSYFFFAGTFKNTRKFKILIEGANLHCFTFIVFCRNYTFNVFFWERKTGFGIAMKKLCEMRDSREKRECGIRTTPSPLPDPQVQGRKSLHKLLIYGDSA